MFDSKEVLLNPEKIHYRTQYAGLKRTQRSMRKMPSLICKYRKRSNFNQAKTLPINNNVNSRINVQQKVNAIARIIHRILDIILQPFYFNKKIWKRIFEQCSHKHILVYINSYIKIQNLGKKSCVCSNMAFISGVNIDWFLLMSFNLFFLIQPEKFQTYEVTDQINILIEVYTTQTKKLSRSKKLRSKQTFSARKIINYDQVNDQVT